MARLSILALSACSCQLISAQEDANCLAGAACTEAEIQNADETVSSVELLQMDQGAHLRQQLQDAKEVKFGSSTSCESWCQYQPSASWATQTGCCSCGGQHCACSCGPYCQYQPASAWSTQTGCCGCQSLLQENASDVSMEALQVFFNKSSDKKETIDAEFGSSTSCAAWCQYQPPAAWATSTDCCGCGGSHCACGCGIECQYQPATAWATQTDCCGCKSLAQQDAKKAEVSEHSAAKEDKAIEKALFGSSASCESWCQYQPASSWATQTGCCSCGGHQCACSCGPYCQYQPASAWSTQTGCCGCQSLLENNSTSQKE